MNALDVFAHWTGVRKGLYDALDNLSDEQLLYSPHEGLRSVGEIACHIAGGAEDWFDYFLKGDWPPIERGHELADCGTVQALRALLEQRFARAQAWLATLTDEDLDRQADLPWGARCTMGYAIWHILEHEIHHRGEIYLMLGLLGIEAPDV